MRPVWVVGRPPIVNRTVDPQKSDWHEKQKLWRQKGKKAGWRTGFRRGAGQSERFPGRRNLSIIMLSGHLDPTYVQAALRAGANAYVGKGNIQALGKALQDVISGNGH